MDKLIEYLISYGSLGVVTAYFLYNDFQDRKNHRAYMEKLMNQVHEHEKRISILEVEK